jgi:protein Tex
VKVLSADTKTKRIALSIKVLLEPSSRPAPTPQATMNKKFAALSTKWKVFGVF